MIESIDQSMGSGFLALVSIALIIFVIIYFITREVSRSTDTKNTKWWLKGSILLGLSLLCVVFLFLPNLPYDTFSTRLECSISPGEWCGFISFYVGLFLVPILFISGIISLVYSKIKSKKTF
ncbi:MAG: hypothetical protein WCP24_02260 [bacterium]